MLQISPKPRLRSPIFGFRQGYVQESFVWHLSSEERIAGLNLEAGHIERCWGPQSNRNFPHWRALCDTLSAADFNAKHVCLRHMGVGNGASTFPDTWCARKIAAATYVTIKYPGRVRCRPIGDTSIRSYFSGTIASEEGSGIHGGSGEVVSGLFTVVDLHNVNARQQGKFIVTSYPVPRG